jgi:GxxExxY protein
MIKQDIPPEINRLSERVIGAAIAVHRELGPGFMESVYEMALCHELSPLGIGFERQFGFKVKYKNCMAGEGRIDLLVERVLVVELKAVDALGKLHEAQLLSYLRALDLPCGLLLNFNAAVLRDGLKRVVTTKGRYTKQQQASRSSRSSASSR